MDRHRLPDAAPLPPHVHLRGGGVSLLVDLGRGDAEPVWLDRALPDDADLAALIAVLRPGVCGNQPDDPPVPSLCPARRRGGTGADAVQLLVDGRLVELDLRLVAARTDGVGAAEFGWHDAAHRISITSEWRIDDDAMLVVATRLTNGGAVPVTLLHLAALALPLPGWASHVTRFAGRWLADCLPQRHRLDQGQIGAASHGGRPGFDGAHWLLLDEAGTSEGHGRALGVHLAWSGDAAWTVAVGGDGQGRLMLAETLDAGEVVVMPGADHRAPPACLALSGAGRAGVRQIFHRHILTRIAPPGVAATPRRVHLNSWEACGFAMDEARLMALADAGAAIGAERFVVDDGWFAGRRDDASALGDWTVAADRFPHGLGPLIAHVQAQGMDFGLWVEPEMISPDSDLARAHPDWCLHLPGSDRPTQRRQWVLDLSRAEVAAHIFAVLDRLLTDHDIAYLKWDHNRPLFPRAGRARAQVLALYALLDRLRAAHPQVEIESCASGGGRVDLGILARCSRFWASDNNDAAGRAAILRGWGQFLPLAITGNHVGASPNPLTGRRSAMDFRAKCAIFGHMGVEADPAAMSSADRACLAAHIGLYKDWRAVIHGGALFALDHADAGVGGWLVVHGARALALVAAAGDGRAASTAPIALPGLEPAARYHVRLLPPLPPPLFGRTPPPALAAGLVLGGAALAAGAIRLPLHLPETAWLLAIERQDQL